MSFDLAQLPQLNIKIDTDKYLSSYLVVCSSQSSWSHKNLVHIPTFFPTFGNLSSGCYYFEYRVGQHTPVVSILFTLCPAFNFNPKILVTDSSLFTGPPTYVFRASPPDKLPSYIDQLLSDLSYNLNKDLSLFTAL